MDIVRKVVNIILYNESNEVLIQQRTDDAPIYPSFYSLFGGKVDDGESPKSAAIRECEEELEYKMLNPTLVVHDFHDSEHGGREKYIYAEKYDSNQKMVLHEGQGMKWVSEEELENIEMIPHDKHYLREIFKNNFRYIKKPQSYHYQAYRYSEQAGL